MLAKYDLLEKQIIREYEHFKQDYSNVSPIKIGEHIYYRNFDNPADAMTLYRFPVVELQKYGFTQS
jgi:hypothetical protein